MAVGSNENDVILDCYRLARFYHVDPRIFLDMTFSEVRTHMERTFELQRQQAAANED
jgi:hypothetical protein